MPDVNSSHQQSVKGEALESDFKIHNWTDAREGTACELLRVPLGRRASPVAHSTATGESLVSNGTIGADIIRLAAGTAFTPHTHPGDHILIVVGGEGTLTYQGKVYPTRAGDIYMIAGSSPHAVGAITDHVIIAVGSPHMPIDSPYRMALVAYDAVTTDILDLHCLICDIHAQYPGRLHDSGCSHCPCEGCHPVPAEFTRAVLQPDGPGRDRT